MSEPLLLASSRGLFSDDFHVIEVAGEPDLKRVCWDSYINVFSDESATIYFRANYAASYRLIDQDILTLDPLSKEMSFTDVTGRKFTVRRPTKQDANALADIGFTLRGTELGAEEDDTDG
jgi:hypothetical protein